MYRRRNIGLPLQYYILLSLSPKAKGGGNSDRVGTINDCLAAYKGVEIITTMDEMNKRRSILRLAIVGVAALCCLVTYLADDRITSTNKSSADMTLRPVLLNDGDAMEEDPLHRLLSQTLETNEDLSIPDWLVNNAGQEGHSSLEEGMQAAMRLQQQQQQESAEIELPGYNIINAIQSSVIFRDSYAILVYDNIDNEFLLLYPSNEEIASAYLKLHAAFDDFVQLLRGAFPDRFCGKDCDELGTCVIYNLISACVCIHVLLFVTVWCILTSYLLYTAIPISSGDYPHLNSHQGCFANFPQASPDCTNTMPILHFGSVFKNYQGLPHMIAMPPPIPSGLACFRQYLRRGKSSVCDGFSSVTSSQQDNYQNLALTERNLGLFANEPQVFNDGDTSKKWDELIPQVIWRGSNFQYLSLMRNGLRNPSLVSGGGDIPTDEIDKIQDVTQRRAAAALALLDKYDKLRPRWKGVVLTAQAEVIAEAKGSLPWANIKLVGEQNKEEGLYEKLLDYGITAQGEKMTPDQMAGYRYQIDIGGGGGTTWTGTIQKMAMPGLLFHHSTVTKDYIHDRMKPYIHYVPVKADLSDLKEKYDWAEANPKAANLIAAQGTQFMRHVGTVEGFGELFDEHFMKPVQRVMNAYEPVSATHPGKSWREVIKQAEGLPDIAVRTKCTASGCTDMEENL